MRKLPSTSRWSMPVIESFTGKARGIAIRGLNWPVHMYYARAHAHTHPPFHG